MYKTVILTLKSFIYVSKITIFRKEVSINGVTIDLIFA